MSLLDSLFGKPNFLKFDDCYALDRERLWEALQNAFQSQLSQDNVVILVCHFAATFSAIQEKLIFADVEYEIATQRLTAAWLKNYKVHARGTVLLALADLIDEQADSQLKQPFDSTTQLAIMVCERHPLRKKDRRIERLGKAIPLPVQLGYFLALDDAVVSLAVNETTLQLLKQMGVEEQELVTSNMVTRRLNKVLDRIEKQIKSDLPADSVEDWLKINAPTRQ